MSANTSQIFSAEAITGMATLKTAMTNFDGTDAVGATFALLWTAGGTNAMGGRLERIRFKPRPVSAGSAPASNVASMAYIFLNNGGVNTTASNNSQLATVPLPATTSMVVGVSTALEPGNIIELPVLPQFVLPVGSDTTALPISLKQGYRIYVGLSVTVAAGWDVTAYGGAF